MSRYLIVCRLRWPALLLLTGVIALLDQMDILTWGRAWPLYLIFLEFWLWPSALRWLLSPRPRPIHTDMRRIMQQGIRRKRESMGVLLVPRRRQLRQQHQLRRESFPSTRISI